MEPALLDFARGALDRFAPACNVVLADASLDGFRT
jgi:hypothetical protein